MKTFSPSELKAALAAQRRPKWDVSTRVPSAVCVPVFERRAGTEVWLIRRPDGMRHHARELAFPGGKADPSDPSLFDTALRELDEELGVPRAATELLGELTTVPVATSPFAIHPFVVAVAPETEPVPAAAEVAELIRVPIARFFDGEVPYAMVDMKLYTSPIFTFPTGRMYGASAHILLELLEACAEIAGAKLPTPERVDEVPWM